MLRETFCHEKEANSKWEKTAGKITQLYTLGHENVRWSKVLRPHLKGRSMFCDCHLSLTQTTDE